MPFAYFFLESEGFAGSKKVQTMGLYLKMKKKVANLSNCSKSLLAAYHFFLVIHVYGCL